MKTCSEIDVTALVQLLEHQRVLYRRLRLLAERQRTLVVADESNSLLELLGERQRLVDGLVQLTSQMAPYRTRWTQLYQEMEETARRQVTSLLEEVNGSLSSILSSDSNDTATLMARRDSVGQQLGVLGESARAGAAYARESAPLSVGAYAEAHA